MIHFLLRGYNILHKKETTFKPLGRILVLMWSLVLQTLPRDQATDYAVSAAGHILLMFMNDNRAIVQ